MNYHIGRLVLSSLCVGAFVAVGNWWCSFCRLKPAKRTPPNTSRNKSSKCHPHLTPPHTPPPPGNITLCRGQRHGPTVSVLVGVCRYPVVQQRQSRAAGHSDFSLTVFSASLQLLISHTQKKSVGCDIIVPVRVSVLPRPKSFRQLYKLIKFPFSDEFSVQLHVYFHPMAALRSVKSCKDVCEKYSGINLIFQWYQCCN